VTAIGGPRPRRDGQAAACGLRQERRGRRACATATEAMSSRGALWPMRCLWLSDYDQRQLLCWSPHPRSGA
jgi:hypothetical protein